MIYMIYAPTLYLKMMTQFCLNIIILKRQIWYYKKTPEGILLIHINARSLCKNYDAITDTLVKLKPHPSIIFISETKLHDSTIEEQLKQIRIDGYRIVYDNSGTAIYINDALKFIERPEIKFDHPNCEACFIEIDCESTAKNPIFGALYLDTLSRTSAHLPATWVNFWRTLLQEVFH